ncbi:LysM peptidoglycan-binding domain-containing protein [Dysgonomonas sp. 520]|uniref:LysM peptidoglycan-binding domain-containing protein n=1 Tax=Dysgonomonas sp. 520 TaxID=2302931 RepID=UPI0013D74690|nr:LysM peptidoglycan-binding domain-containing protein [Dysgonomonas sp. 520]NDW10526.1 LysM peptidoglycan-binding domain-containing protein [Dysgonomonas sp. 520]
MVKKIIITSFALFNIAVVGIVAQKHALTLKDTITDKSIVVPPDMERNYDKLLVDWNKNIKVSKACKTKSDQNVTYPDSVYINRLHAFPSRMELVYNQIVRSYIDMYSGRRRGQVAYMLAEGGYYFPIFESALDKYNLPLELKYLPVIESALKPTAVSPVGATGLWQFMLATGRMYDLEVNSLVDQRRNPIKATDAAARYLRDLYNIYNDWNLVIAAYNCGPGNVNKAIRRSNGQTDYWAIYPYLPRETRGYVPAFIAATYIMSYYKEHNICPLEYNYPIATDTLTVNKTVHFQQISDVLKIPIEDIRALNPQYKQDIVPGNYKPYVLSLPTAKAMDFITHYDTIVAHRASELLTHRKTVDMDSHTSGGSVSTRKIIHKVKKGETLARIASRYGVTSAQIKKWNKLKSNRLTAGRRLTINKPVPKTTATTNTKKEETTEQKDTSSNSSQATSSTSEGGGSLMSNYYKQQHEKAEATADSEKDGDDSDTTSVEQPIRKNYQEATKTIYHKVRIGETITLIASKYDVTKEDIIKWNKLSSNAVKVGQRLIIYIPDKPENSIQAVDTTKTAQTKATEKSEAAKTATTPKPETKKKTEPATKKPVKPKNITYTVRKGDNLSKIAQKYRGVTSSDIKKANKLANDNLNVGQKLVIPQK